MNYPLLRGGVSPDVVEVLELMLENAKNGNITGIAIAATMEAVEFLRGNRREPRLMELTRPLLSLTSVTNRTHRCVFQFS